MSAFAERSVYEKFGVMQRQMPEGARLCAQHQPLNVREPGRFEYLLRVARCIAAAAGLTDTAALLSQLCDCLGGALPQSSHALWHLDADNIRFI
jgi:hypothetical protein